MPHWGTQIVEIDVGMLPYRFHFHSTLLAFGHVLDEVDVHNDGQR
jgi:hypothetical protein